MPRTHRAKKPVKWFTVIFQVACLNFVLFLAVTLLLGGSALGGRSENGLYFVERRGKFTEVSLATFIYSLIHAYVSFALILLTLVMGFCAGSKSRKRQRVSRGAHRNI